MVEQNRLISKEDIEAKNITAGEIYDIIRSQTDDETWSNITNDRGDSRQRRWLYQDPMDADKIDYWW